MAKIDEIKLKPIIPVLRQKKRFVKVQIISSKKFTFKEVSEDLIENIILYLGAIDFGKNGIWILKDKFDEKNQTIILKVSTKSKDRLVGVLALITKIAKIDCRLNVLRVSGTLKGVEKIVENNKTEKENNN